MKKTICILGILLLAIPFVLAIYGGETYEYDFGECDKVLVNINANDTIDVGEYWIHNDCEHVKDEAWLCDCEGNFTLSIQFGKNTVNNYSIDISDNYSIDWQKQDNTNNGGSSSSSGTTGGSSYYKFTKKNGVKTFYMKPNVFSRFNVNGYEHKIVVKEVGEDYVIIEIHSEPIKIKLELGKEVQIDLDGDMRYDLSLTLKEIRGRIALIDVKEIDYTVPKDNETFSTPIEQLVEQPIEELPETIQSTPTVIENEGMPLGWKIAIVVFLVITLIVIIVIIMNKNDE